MKQDEIIEMARQAGDVLTDSRGRMDFCFDNYGLEAFANLVAAKEREACAKLCDSTIHDTYIEGYTGARHSGRRECAAAIRARGKQA